MDELLIKVLREAKELKEHNLSCYSTNWTYVNAKPGYEKQHEQARREYQEVISLLEFYTV